MRPKKIGPARANAFRLNDPVTRFCSRCDSHRLFADYPCCNAVRRAAIPQTCRMTRQRRFPPPWSVEETNPELSSFSCLLRLQPVLVGREGHSSRVPGSWQSPGGHSRDLTLCGALRSPLSVARGDGDPWRVARLNVIRKQASEPHCTELEHKTRGEFRPIRKR